MRDSGGVLEEGRPSAEGCRAHHVVDHLGEPTGGGWAFKQKDDLFGREINGMTLKAKCAWLERRSIRDQFPRVIAGASPESGHDHNSVRLLGWPLGWPLVTCCHVATSLGLLHVLELSFSLTAQYQSEMRSG
jgi:hypothetical protein